MSGLIPNRLLFSFEFEISYFAKPPRMKGLKKEWPAHHQLPCLAELDTPAGTDAMGGALPVDFGTLWAGWHESGLYVAAEVRGKKKPLNVNPDRFWDGDNIRICTDMRDARDNKRATRFCQQFYFLPEGGGPQGKRPLAGSQRIHRATSEAPAVSSDGLDVSAKVSKTGYFMECFIRAESLYGFDPQEHDRIGFYVIIEDSELGQQYLTVGDSMSWHIDPSTWASAVLLPK
ncbi:MAG: sugar-binding protein [Phycisphaerae bacterium]